jgi:hypothetical protein
MHAGFSFPIGRCARWLFGGPDGAETGPAGWGIWGADPDRSCSFVRFDWFGWWVPVRARGGSNQQRGLISAQAPHQNDASTRSIPLDAIMRGANLLITVH